MSEILVPSAYRSTIDKSTAGRSQQHDASVSSSRAQLERLQQENEVLLSTVQCLAEYLPPDVRAELLGVSLHPIPTCKHENTIP